jgi:N-acetylglucosamine repressor
MTKIRKGFLDADISNLKKRVLAYLHQEKEVSRIQIASQLNISPATVGVICKDLIDSGMIVTVGTGQSTGGRRPTFLRLNERGNYFIGCDLGINHIITVLVDIYGNVLDCNSVHINSRSEVDVILDRMISSIRSLIQAAESKQLSVIGIGLSLPGLLDISRGISVFAPNLTHWRDVPIIDRIKNEFGLAVFMDNDARAMALGEFWFGAGRGKRNLVCVNIGSGIGSGIIIEGRLYQGVAGGAGEIGHVTVNDNGPRCPCGSNGCLELMASGPAIAARAIQAVSIGASTQIQALTAGNFSLIDAKVVAEAARQGDKLAIDILMDAGRFIGIGVATVANLLSPEMVIIGGGVAQSGEFFIDMIRSTVYQRAYTIIVNKLEIVSSQLKENASAIGAAAIFIQQSFGAITVE